MTVYISSDHGGFELKNKVLEKFQMPDTKIVDLGPNIMHPGDDYPVFAFNLAERVVEEGGTSEGIFGILICRSGIGMSIAANKVDGCYAALCNSINLARVSRAHNNANVLVIDADYRHDDVLGMIESFITTRFEAGRHERRVMQIQNYELKKSEEPLG